jgi:hypothetical protein
VLAELKAKLKAFEVRTGDPWILKWERVMRNWLIHAA